MKEFSFSTRIFFGEGALERLYKVQNKRVMIVTDSFMASSGVADRVASYLKDCEVTVFSDVVPDPPIEVVAAGVACFQQCRPQVMIAVGGGSVIDAAKAIRVVAGRIPGSEDTSVMECFAIPTTSGTGSEVTEYAVVTDLAKGVKYPLASRELRPVTALLDPELVVSAPPRVTADSGMDVLTHALEAYVSTGANDFSDALAEKAISLVVKWLPIAFENGNDLLAREKMHNASCMAGLAFNSAGLGLCHGIAHGIGSKLHLPHGRANAIVLPHILRFNADLDHVRGGNYTVAAKKYQRLAKILDLPCSSVTVGFSQFLKTVEKLNKQLQIPNTLKKGGYDMALFKQERENIIDSAMAAQDYYKMFMEWTQEYGKTYANAGEHAKRFENFKSNVALINLLNRQNSGATFALNKFADMSQEEFAAKYLHPMKAPETREARRILPVNLEADYPTSLNWIEKGAVNAVKNQGECGSCYAFSALCSMEGAYFLAHGELPILAEQQIVDCESDCIQGTCDSGCDGGLMPNVYTYAIREGMMPASAYSYTGVQGSCKYSASKAKYAFSDWYFVDADEDSMVAALNTAGPLAVGVDATYWSYYSSGIYSSSCSTSSMNHGVAIVGYGVSSNKKYWIIRNSWGTSWGEDGYLKLSRGSNKCGVNNYVCAVVA